MLAGVAVEDTGELVATLEGVPFIGGQVGDVASRVREAEGTGERSREPRHTDDASVLLALSIGLIPTLPLLGLYVPLRLAWTQVRAPLQRALATIRTISASRQFLARRAVANLHYRAAGGQPVLRGYRRRALRRVSRPRARASRASAGLGDKKEGAIRIRRYCHRG